MNGLLAHRGPDDEGLFVDRDLSAALGARRLSIIDVANGHQPLTNEDGTVVAVLNGEIYNYRALRTDLLARGHILRTESDTEVLVHLYEDFGGALVHALEGMFAFAILDRRSRRLLLARDRFGEKPLFYAVSDGALAFASELTALVAGTRLARVPAPEAIDSYFVLGYVPSPETIFPPHRQLPPGHLLTWRMDQRELHLESYWRPLAYVPSTRTAWADVVAEGRQLLHESVQSRLIADVPVGVLLSGGVDSTLIAAVAAQHTTRPLKSFTVTYDVGRVGEEDAAATSARLIGADHTCLVLASTDVAELAGSTVSRLDQPLADEALLATHAIARVARQQVKVAVGGEGADEMFAGYPRYRWLPVAHRLRRRWAPRAAAGLIDRMSSGRSTDRFRRISHSLATSDPDTRYLRWVTGRRLWARPHLYGPLLADFRHAVTRIAGPSGGAEESMEALMLRDQRMWLPDDVLAKGDRASMLASLELRTPYLERTLVEFAATVPAVDHARRGGKRLIRDILELELPLADAHRRKAAFRVPMGQWLRGPLAGMLDEQLDRGLLVEQGYFDRAFLHSIAKRHMDRESDWSDVLWPVLALGIWADHVVGG